MVMSKTSQSFSTNWFTGDKDGLRQINERLVERRGFGLIAGELYQNVMDTTATECHFTIEKVPGKPRVRITVVDNGPGFSKLSDAWTMFAPSEKKSAPTKAGRFNLGEKMVLSFAYEASIHTTSGTVEFNEEGRQFYPRRKRESGTSFTAELACTSERYDELVSQLDRIMVRDGLDLWVNGRRIQSRTPQHQWDEVLPTEIGDDLRKTKRRTEIMTYEVEGDETAMLYELGIPVVETGDRWHVSIQQKVPLNTDRDNVTPAYLRAVRVAVLNRLHWELDGDDTEGTWVNEAAASPDCSDDAVESFRVQKYGDKSVAEDPFNPEANAMALSSGFTVIPSRGLSSGQRKNLYSAGTLRSTSAQFPTAGKGAYSDDPNAPPVEVIPQENWTEAMGEIYRYALGLGHRLMGRDIGLRFVRCPSGPCGRWRAAYGGGQLDFNVLVLGKKWFEQGASVEVADLILHEFGHEYESDHCSADYHKALTKLGAKLKRDAIDDAEWFRKFEPVKLRPIKNEKVKGE